MSRMLMVFYGADLLWQGDAEKEKPPDLFNLPYGAFVYRTLWDQWFTNVNTGRMIPVDVYEVPAGYRTLALLFKE